MKKLIVCGDSFMSPRSKHPGKHFVELFAKHLGFELTSYARAGVSNGSIVIQLESALQQKPDLILFNLTNSDRTEFRVDQDRALNFYESININNPYFIKELCDVSWDTCQTSDAFYANIEDKRLGSVNYTTVLAPVITEDEKKFGQIMANTFIDYDKKIHTLKEYYRYIFDEKWERQKQQMMMFAMTYRLYKNNIPFILVHDYLKFTDCAYTPDWFVEKHSVNDKTMPMRLDPKPVTSDPGWHLSYEDSEIVAKILIEHYDLYFK